MSITELSLEAQQHISMLQRRLEYLTTLAPQKPPFERRWYLAEAAALEWAIRILSQNGQTNGQG